MFRRLMVTCLLAGCLSVSQAIAQPAYWVIESNINSMDKTTIKVYNPLDQLIAEKEIQRRVDISRKKDRRMLNKFVKTALKEQQVPVVSEGTKVATKSRRR
jgi:hypothetical protein